MNNSRLIFDYLRQRKQLYTIVLASFYLSRRVDENSVRIIIEILSALRFLTPNFYLLTPNSLLITHYNS